MEAIALVTTLVVATAVRARKAGHTWKRICAFPSQWFNWTFFGRGFEETFSAYVGLQMRDGGRPQIVWWVVQTVIDTVSLPFERHHCAESLYRLESKNRNREHTIDGRRRLQHEDGADAHQGNAKRRSV